MLCPLLYTTEHVSRGEKGEKGKKRDGQQRGQQGKGSVKARETEVDMLLAFLSEIDALPGVLPGVLSRLLSLSL